MNRVVFGGIVGGFVMFVWGALSHMALPIGQMGIEPVRDEAPLIEAMRGSLDQHAIYFFPSAGMEGGADEKAAWSANYLRGPVGLIVFQPTGKSPMNAGMLVTELVSNILAAMVAAWILMRVNAPRRTRIAIVGMLGLFSWLSIEVSYWNWYGFPPDYAFAQLLDAGIGWTLAGLVLAAIARPTPALRAAS